MKKFYVTFGQIHVHRVNDKTFDCNCVCEIEAENSEEVRTKAFEVFGAKFCFIEKEPNLEYYPRGIIKLINNKKNEN